MELDLILASDLHGSDSCFKKLIALAEELRVSAIVIAGDWSGKQTVFKSNGEAFVEDRETRTLTKTPESEAAAFRDRGGYIVEFTGDITVVERQALTDDARRRRLREWLDYGRDRTIGIGTKLLAIPGNDDGPEIDDILSSHDWAINLDEHVEVFRSYHFFGLGYSTPTPWHTVRELTEEQIANRLENIAAKIDNWDRAVGVIHVPPYGTGLDYAPDVAVSQDPREIPKATGWDERHVGSHSVRHFVEKYNPLAILSGHCHTSKGLARLNATICANAGSFYASRLLSAYYLRFSGKRLAGRQYFLV